MNEPFVWSRDPAVGPKPRERFSVMRPVREPRNNILIRTQVRGVAPRRELPSRRGDFSACVAASHSRLIGAQAYPFYPESADKGDREEILAGAKFSPIDFDRFRHRLIGPSMFQRTSLHGESLDGNFRRGPSSFYQSDRQMDG